MCLKFISTDGAIVAATESVAPISALFCSIALSRYGGARSVACAVSHSTRIPTITLFTCADASQHQRRRVPSAAAPAAPFATLHRTRHVNVGRLRAPDRSVYTSFLRSEEKDKLSDESLPLEDPDFLIPR